MEGLELLCSCKVILDEKNNGGIQPLHVDYKHIDIIYHVIFMFIHIVVEPVDTSSAPKETATTETRNEDKPEVSSEPVVPAGFKMIKKKVLNFNVS